MSGTKAVFWYVDDRDRTNRIANRTDDPNKKEKCPWHPITKVLVIRYSTQNRIGRSSMEKF